MRKAFQALLAAGAALCSPALATTPASAATVTQVYDAGRCMVDRDRRAVVNILEALPLGTEPANLSVVPDDLARRCLRNVDSAVSLHLRGAIAQALFLRDFRGMGIEPRRSIALVDMNLPVQRSNPGDRSVELYRWADCLVRNNGRHTELLLASPVGSRGEEGAIEGLRPYMRPCAPDGADLAVQASELRSVLAQSAYHSMFRYWTRQLDSVRTE